LVVPRKIYVAVDDQYAIVYAFFAAHFLVPSAFTGAASCIPAVTR